MWRNWNPRTLLVRMQNGAAALESSLAVTEPAIQLLGMYPRELKAFV